MATATNNTAKRIAAAVLAIALMAGNAAMPSKSQAQGPRNEAVAALTI